MPDVKNLVSKFAWSYELPVTIEGIIAALRDLGVTDEINLVRDERLNSQIMQGYFIRWVKVEADGSKHYISDIHYAPNEDPFMEKLVCCKELLHILDPENARVRSDEELDSLISGIILPPQLQDSDKDSLSVLTDRAAVIQALAVMFPFNARNVLVRRMANKEISLEDISVQAEIPLDYTAFAMSNRWHDVYKRLLPGRQ